MLGSPLMEGLAIAVLVAAVSAASDAQTLPKKLVKLGWDLKQPGYVETNIREMEKRPFDGIFIRPTFGHTFYMRDMAEKDAAAEIEAMGRIEWEKFTDNFIYFHCDDNVDWFDDELWGEDSPFLRNIGWCAKAARVGRCVGLAFDPEFVYWGRPHCAWKYEYQKWKGQKSFAEYEEMVRKRGAQYMDRIEEEFPNPVILTLFWTSMTRFQEAAVEADLEKREAILKEDYYGLLPAFMVGMLEAADPGTIIVDGNEGSYYYNEELHYLRSYHASNWYDASLYAIMDGVASLSIAVLIWYGSGRHLQGAVTLGLLVAFIQYIQRVFVPIRELSAP